MDLSCVICIGGKFDTFSVEFSFLSDILTVLFQELIPELYYLPEMFVNSNNVRLVFIFCSSISLNQPIKNALLLMSMKIVVI